MLSRRTNASARYVLKEYTCKRVSISSKLLVDMVLL